MARTAVESLSALDRYLEASRDNYKACLDCLDRTVHIDGVDVNVRFHHLKFDPNGRPKFDDLAKCLADHLIEYSFSARRRGKSIKPRDFSRLNREARELLRRSSKSGEAGEMLLYFLQEAVLGAPQMVARIDLKTNPALEVNGSDGIHMKWNDAQQVLDIYHGESKLEKSVSRGLTNAFKSMRNFHVSKLAEHELKLVTSHYKWADSGLKDAVLRFVDRSKSGGDCRVNHACLIGYDWSLYKELVKSNVDNLEEEFRKFYAERAPKLTTLLARRFKKFKLKRIGFEFFFLPFESVEDFRAAFERAVRGYGGRE